MKSELMVTIRCAAYNHERYIRQCLEGFVMQKTNFRFEAIVHDDASTDGTAKIIKEYADKYPDIIKPIFETENQYRKNNLTAVMNSHMHGKYIAFCEGDDYWIDPFKLQKQVDFLESHPNFSICTHRYFLFYQEEQIMQKDKLDNCFIKDEDGIVFDIDYNYNKRWLTKTLTSLVRKEAMVHFMNLNLKNGRDTVMFYYILKYGKGYCFNQFWGCYRIHNNGVVSKVSNSNRFLNAYLSYKQLYKMEGGHLLREKMCKEYCNYFISTPITKSKIKPSIIEIFALLYYIPTKAIKRIIKKLKRK